MAGDHPRNTGPMLASLRCGAKTRSGQPCRMHGGARGSGAPRGNRNAWKTGQYSRESRDEWRRIRDYLRTARSFLKEVK
jgi:uncharacterized protein YjcR